uniref:Uncharacterized protein n=1 Tax=Arundo donax TaxID=35708 RepID=A0A0A9FR09_ARUDO
MFVDNEDHTMHGVPCMFLSWQKMGSERAAEQALNLTLRKRQHTEHQFLS